MLKTRKKARFQCIFVRQNACLSWENDINDINDIAAALSRYYETNTARNFEERSSTAYESGMAVGPDTANCVEREAWEALACLLDRRAQFFVREDRFGKDAGKDQRTSITASRSVQGAGPPAHA